MEAYHQSLDEQQAESETENMSQDESENFLQSIVKFWTFQNLWIYLSLERKAIV